MLGFFSQNSTADFHRRSVCISLLYSERQEKFSVKRLHYLPLAQSDQCDCPGLFASRMLLYRIEKRGSPENGSAGCKEGGCRTSFRVLEGVLATRGPIEASLDSNKEQHPR